MFFTIVYERVLSNQRSASLRDSILKFVTLHDTDPSFMETCTGQDSLQIENLSLYEYRQVTIKFDQIVDCACPLGHIHNDVSRIWNGR